MDALTRLCQLVFFHLNVDLDMKLQALVCKLGSPTDGESVFLGLDVPEDVYARVGLPGDDVAELTLPRAVLATVDPPADTIFGILEQAIDEMVCLEEALGAEAAGGAPDLAALADENRKADRELLEEVAATRALRAEAALRRDRLVLGFYGNGGEGVFTNASATEAVA